jgi:hypothetical protein
MDDIGPIVAIVMIFGTPIIAILTSHQRKMAELFRSQPPTQLANPETMALREEIRELKELVHQQAIAIDNMNRPVPMEPRIHERVG